MIKEKGKDFNLLPSPIKQPKSVQADLIIFFHSRPVNENIYVKTSSKYLLFTRDLIF